MKKHSQFLTISALVFLLSGCSCSRRMERLMRECPDCFTQKEATAWVHDTIVTPSHHLDTILPLSDLFTEDGLTLHYDNITLQIIYDEKNASASISADVTPDTVYTSQLVSIPVECPAIPKKGRTAETILTLAAVLAFFCWCTIYNLRKYKKEKQQ